MGSVEEEEGGGEEAKVERERKREVEQRQRDVVSKRENLLPHLVGCGAGLFQR